MKSYLLQLLLLAGLFWSVSGCKKTPDAVTPTTPTLPPGVDVDPRPVLGNYRILITNPGLQLGMICRDPKFKVDIMAFGVKNSDGILTSITRTIIYNPNTKDWIETRHEKGYPTQITTSKGYLIEYKNYDKSARTVDITIKTVADGKVVKEAQKKVLSTEFFQNIDQYTKNGGGRRGGSTSACEDAERITAGLGGLGNGVACALGIAAAIGSEGLILLSGPGLALLLNCYGAIDGLLQMTGLEKTSLTNQLLGDDGACAFNLATGALTATSSAIWLETGLGYMGAASAGFGCSPCGNPGSGTGDPHLTTFDGLYYDFQGHGEFIAVKSTTDNFEVQVRQEDTGKTGQITLNTAIAIQMGTDVVCVTTQPNRLFVNNRQQDLNATQITLSAGAMLYKAIDANLLEGINLITKNGDVVKIRFFGTYLLDYSIYLADNRKGKIGGLLGNYDGDETNDVQIRSGASILTNGSIQFSKLYPAYADSWRVALAQSLLYYDTGKTTESYTQKDFPRSAQTLTSQQRSWAQGVCRAAGVVEEPFLSNCIVDVGIANDASLAGSSLWGQQVDFRPSTPPVSIIVEAVNVKAIATHDNSTFLLKADGTLWVAGWGSHGVFGIGKEVYEFDAKSGFVKIMDGIKDIASGGMASHMLMLKTDNSVWAAGYNSSGQIGNGAKDGNNALTAVKIMTDARSMAVGTYQSFVIKTDNTLWAFGKNDNGQLGDGSKTDRFVPVKMMNDVLAVSAGNAHTLILKTDNTVWATGFNAYGQFGNGTQTFDDLSPKKIFTDGKAIATGSDFSLILKTDNTLWGAGNNNVGQLGNGSDGSGNVVKTFAKLMDNVRSISAAADHTLLLKTDNTLWATGSNQTGQLGNGTFVNRKTPVNVLSAVQYMTTGSAGNGGSTFVVKTNNTLWVAGANPAGELGDGTQTDRPSFVPVNVK